MKFPEPSSLSNVYVVSISSFYIYMYMCVCVYTNDAFKALYVCIGRRKASWIPCHFG